MWPSKVDPRCRVDRRALEHSRRDDLGVGNSAANVAWISSLRATADGSGSVRISPDTLTHGQSVTLNVTYKKDAAFPATGIRIVFPAAFGWSHSTADVALISFSATATVSGDTITLASVAMAGDSGTVQIAGILPPDSTAFYFVRVESKSQAAFRAVSPQPMVKVFGLPVPIALVKGNDANGIPLRAGQLVTTRGIVTVANQFGGPSYIQDNTSGMVVYGLRFSSAVTIGDEVVVSGVIDPFGGLTELTSPLLHAIVSPGTASPRFL